MNIVSKADTQVNRLLLEKMKPIIEKQAHDIVQRMKNQFRSGKVQNGELISFVAELCAIEDMENGLKANASRKTQPEEELK